VGINPSISKHAPMIGTSKFKKDISGRHFSLSTSIDGGLKSGSSVFRATTACGVRSGGFVV
jgi:hypothetical protein